MANLLFIIIRGTVYEFVQNFTVDSAESSGTLCIYRHVFKCVCVSAGV